MEIYLLKSTACMGIFLLFYKLLLENESMHQFKRYFLLTAVIASFIIPQIVFTEYIELEPTTAVTQIISINESQKIQPVIQAVETSPMNWSLILWTIYGLGVAGFALRFLINLHKIWKRIHNNPKTKHSAIYRILLKEQLPPHTFLRYIFLNKQKFETKSIPNSVLIHEETHAIQRHSLDVLFIEVLQVLFWFNPLIYAFKKTIKLNHEFLADSAVLNGQEDHLNYQNTLLSYLSNGNLYSHQSVGIANAINYSSIKKRFIIMKKQTSKKGIVIRSLLLLPILALMLYGFSDRKEKIVSEPDNYSINGDWLNKENELEKLTITEENENLLWGNNQGLILKIEKIEGQFYYYSELNKEKLLVETNAKEETIQINGERFIRKEKSLRNQLNGTWRNEENNIKIIVSEYDIYMVFDFIKGDKKAVRYYPKKRGNGYYFTYGYEDWTFKIENNQLIDSRGNHYTRLEKQQTTIPKITVNINKQGELLVQDDLVELNDLEKYLSLINPHLTTKEKSKIVKTIIKIVPDSPKEIIAKVEEELTTYGAATIDIQEYNSKTNKIKRKATSVQIKEYNKLAKRYNTMISKGGNIRILKSDVDQLTNIYGIMSEKQKTAAEPFPDFPKPPPVPKAPNSSDYADSQINEIIENQDPYDHLNLDKKAINGIPSNTQTFHSKPSSPVAPPPPTPPSPLDYAISMAKKGATFFYEDKEISSDKAIDLLKKNKELNMESRKKNGKTELRITKEPVTIR
ncbi:BlaR1 peptidase M56 [Maribacter caenipelagi]|uniref:BlaR1 peptidase M56 n=1 Tax=Maribacter caenipelagi TaxID=1447781 RepID=A0A4V3E2Z2_9FLAO|nr:M56 family metallopeptidase [Maribacter caenipelagi]TDS19128.1 BlaR1 peptidase M56 [Maribacter caenipelagi]